ncbi:MAG: lysophospholipid acyltransferase family protein [Rhodocyclaceae bacterium]|nr:lysophospholipid acyltransferase family protein [Rhodocyclaceae bacterium]MBX3670063.1 lysophospholipid acyltransferase family protein [Rhodocyclaceae bacterium]
MLAVLSRLPLSVLHRLGALVGWLVYGLSPTYRRHLRENLALAFPANPRLRRAAIAQAGMALMELPKLWLRPPEEVCALIREVRGWEIAQRAHDEGRGIVFLTPHLGCFEISAMYIGGSIPMTVLYRPPKQRWLEPYMQRGRGARMKLAPANLSGVRELLRALRKHGAVGLLPDQVPGNGEGVWAPFFGRPAYTMTLAARLLESGAALISVSAERLPQGAGYRLSFYAPELPPQADAAARAAAINAEIERLIRLCPQQYLWGYNRYKGPGNAEAPAQPQ